MSDLHGEPEALRRGLEAGEVGAGERLWILGDCLDKGPDPWGLLDALATRRAVGALTLLAGNHDLRVLMGLRALGSQDPRRLHLFARLGTKSLSLLEGSLGDATPVLSEAAAERELFPDAAWYTEAEGHLAGDPVRELARLRSKEANLRAAWSSRGHSLAELHAAACAARARFEAGGAYAWFHASLRLTAREGDLLCVHAGLSDLLAEELPQAAEWELELQRALAEEALPELYWGRLAPLLRTKHRPRDEPFGERGASALRGAGVRLVVHGHQPQRDGQVLSLRGGLPHLVVDTTSDGPSRALAGLEGPGGGVTSFLPEGLLRAWSSDAGWKELRVEVRAES